MSEQDRWQLELSEYIRQGEPDRAEKSAAWQTAIGLQAVDGLKSSSYLLETAKEHIEGNIDIATYGADRDDDDGGIKITLDRSVRQILGI